ncbi:MAG: hypothetical protein ACXAAO_05550 [Candidatus Thorarchaeota archaeon]
MSGSISRKRRHVTLRQRSKEEIRWYTKFFAAIIKDKHEKMLFPNSEYTILTSKQILRLTQGPRMRRK